MGYSRLKMPSPIEDVKNLGKTYLEIQTAKFCQCVKFQTTFEKSTWKS